MEYVNPAGAKRLAPLDSSEPQAQLAREMLDFVNQIPPSIGLDWLKDYDFLYFFEAERVLLMREVLLRAGFDARPRLRVLDVGFLHGLIPEFLHRSFPQASFVVLDYPKSSIFNSPVYLELIRQRTYLTLEPFDIRDVSKRQEQFDLIVLGEVIEHMDPSSVAAVMRDLRARIAPDGLLLITTPNGAGAMNLLMTLSGKDVQHPPIAHDTMGFAHIHLWTPNTLAGTLEHFGWQNSALLFYSGLDRREAAQLNREWGSLKRQLGTRLALLMSRLVPRWRGFMISAWRPT